MISRSSKPSTVAGSDLLLSLNASLIGRSVPRMISRNSAPSTVAGLPSSLDLADRSALAERRECSAVTSSSGNWSLSMMHRSDTTPSSVEPGSQPDLQAISNGRRPLSS